MEAAVAIIRARTPEPAYLILRRALNPADPWSGHFSLPGGRRDKQDLNLLETCLRETREECGIDLPLESMKKELPWTEAGNAFGIPVRVTPFLFELPRKPPVHLDAAECSGHFWVPQAHLLDSDNHEWIQPLPDPEWRFPAIPLGGGHIWGFTYKVLADLLEFPRRPEGAR